MSSRADLELAEVALRDILRAELPPEVKPDGMSLSRMLVYLVNMHAALGTSPDRHADVVKRLDDFATTTSRMAGRNPGAAPKLSRLSESLRAASVRLREATVSVAN